MEREVGEYVAACLVCVSNKASHSQPAGLSRPLSDPCHPWACISVDFVSGLPDSGGNTVILTVIEKFTKMTHFLPLPKLPSAKETAEVMLAQVFRLHSFPRDVVSDQGPQFSSRFWWEFCKFVGIMVSLYSGYCPQSNGQTERMNQELEFGLRCLCSHKPASWSKWIGWVWETLGVLFPRALSFSVCLQVPVSPIPSAGEGGHCSLCPCPHLLLSSYLEAGSPLAPPLLSPICGLGQLLTSSRTHLSFWATGLALLQESAPSCSFPQAGPQVCGALPSD